MRLAVDRRRAPVIRLIFREYLRQGSLAALAGFLAGKGIANRGRPWSRQALLWILKNPAYTGAVSSGAGLARGAHPAIITASVFARVRQALSRRRRRGVKGGIAIAERKGNGNPVARLAAQA